MGWRLVPGSFRRFRSTLIVGRAGDSTKPQLLKEEKAPILAKTATNPRRWSH
jgi:hypothetical protein